MFRHLIVIILVVAVVGLMFSSVSAADVTKPNVLFIAVDDLRPELGCYGEKIVKSPNIDSLAAAGVRFTRAYCQEAICGPSRASLLTGLRPDSAGVVHNMTYFRDTVPDVVTLPQHFRNHGYQTVYIGKIYHANMKDEEKSWSRRAVYPPRYQPSAVGGYQLPENKELVKRKRAETKAKYGTVALGGLANGPATECADVPDRAYQDGFSAEAAILTMREIKDKPFFLAVGFYKPHLPFVAPKRYWDLYNPAEIELAENPFAPKGAPSIGLHSSFELRTRHGVPKSGPISEAQARRLIHAYYACASYVDAQIGRMLAELDRLELRNNTIIVVWGDHGWHLGEHSIWGKATNYEIATRVPLVVSAPGMKARGAASDALVELVDIYPALSELAGLPLPEHLEGTSFAPLLDDPDGKWKSAAFSQFPCPALREWAALPLSDAMRETFFGPLIRTAEQRLESESPDRYTRDVYENHLMGYTMRTDRYRLVRWVDERAPDGKEIALELYDHQTDPDENVNLANDPANADLLEKLIAQAKAGWRKSRPPAPDENKTAGIVVEVAAGGHNRSGTPVFFDLPEPLRPYPAFTLTRLDKDETIDVQRVSGESRITWLIGDTLAAGNTRRYGLAPAESPGGPPPEVTFSNDGKHLLVKVGDRPVLQYNHAEIPSPSPLEAYYKRSGYIHPLFNPAGQIITDDFPPDHAHQHGLFFAWVNTTFEGRQVDFWNQAGGTGRVGHVAFKEMIEGNVFGQFTAVLRHDDLTAPGGAKPVLNETWTVRVYNLSDRFLVDVESKQSCATDSPLTINEFYYGGLALRGSRQWFGQAESDFLTSERKTRTDGNHTRPRWVEAHGLIDGKPTGVTVMCHPANFGFPQPVRLHPTKPYFCFAPMVLGPVSIAPGKDYISRYRYSIHTGEPEAQVADRLWLDFANPPRARVVEQL